MYRVAMLSTRHIVYMSSVHSMQVAVYFRNLPLDYCFRDGVWKRDKGKERRADEEDERKQGSLDRSGKS